jgi:hypothetical protein
VVDRAPVGVESRLTRRALAVLGVAVAAVVVGLAIGVVVRGGAEETGVPPGARFAGGALDVRTRVLPSVHLFGEPIVAEVDLRVNRTIIDPDRVRLQLDFDPYERIEVPSVRRAVSGKDLRLTYRYRLRCLGEGCDPSGALGAVEFPTGRIRYHFLADPTGRGAFAEVDWPGVTVTGRVAAPAVTRIEWRAEQETLAAVTYRSGPRLTAILLLLLAVALAGAAAALAWMTWGRRRETAIEAEGSTSRTPLEIVLEAARLAALNGDLPLRRRALESVARELGDIGLDELAADARTLAWSPADATSADVDELARRSEVAAEAAL